MQPVKKRYIILDALRGFALLGICLANFPEFSLYSFLSAADAARLQTPGLDRVLRGLLYFFVDGKFYTVFSLLFGIGFSIILEHATAAGGRGLKVFYRRMLCLLGIGLIHLWLLWSGDILTLYAVLGMLLPLWRRCSDRGLLRWAGFFLLLPVAVDAVVEAAQLRPAGWFYDRQWALCARYGITEENFACWLRDCDGYRGVHQFLMQGGFERMTEFIDGNRYFKVLGLFLLGYWAGRNRFYARLGELQPLLRRIVRRGFALGLPLSALYAWSGMNGHPWGLTAHTALYTVSVFPMGFAYVAGLCLLYLRCGDGRLWRALAAPGRMALSNYLFQTVCGMLIFYGGIGLGLGAGMSLSLVLPVAVGVYLLGMALSAVWMRHFRFGPVEWIWRMLTYGAYLPLRKKDYSG